MFASKKINISLNQPRQKMVDVNPRPYMILQVYLMSPSMPLGYLFPRRCEENIERNESELGFRVIDTW